MKDKDTILLEKAYDNILEDTQMQVPFGDMYTINRYWNIKLLGSGKKLSNPAQGRPVEKTVYKIGIVGSDASGTPEKTWQRSGYKYIVLCDESGGMIDLEEGNSNEREWRDAYDIVRLIRDGIRKAIKVGEVKAFPDNPSRVDNRL